MFSAHPSHLLHKFTPASVHPHLPNQESGCEPHEPIQDASRSMYNLFSNDPPRTHTVLSYIAGLPSPNVDSISPVDTTLFPTLHLFFSFFLFLQYDVRPPVVPFNTSTNRL